MSEPEQLHNLIDTDTMLSGQTPKQIHDQMRAALDQQLIAALANPMPASAAILTAAIKRVEQLGKEINTDPNSDMAEQIERLRQRDAIIPEVNLHDDDPATDKRY